MSLWVKICGNTSFEDAMLAAEAGADAVGFVLAPSPRQVTADQVAIIASKLPPSIEKIGVFVDAGFDEIEATVSSCGLTGIQLHFEAGQDLTRKLRERFGPAIRIFGVVHVPAQSVGSDGDEGQKKDSSSAFLDDHVDAVLVDSCSLTSRGGTGQVFDWSLQAATLFRATLKPKVAAGGLTPDNVAEAIRILRPWGVDVVSGVEAFPGRKDPGKVRAFLNNARLSTLPRSRTLK